MLSRAQTVLTSTLVLTRANNGQTFTNYRISTTSGPCVTINGATNITIQASNIGPCGAAGGTTDQNGIHIVNSSYINVYDSYIHVEKHSTTPSTRCGVLLQGTNGHVTIQGNVIAYNETNIELSDTVTDATVIGNYLLNPRGPYPRGQNVQVWSSSATPSSNITVSYNYAFSCVLHPISTGAGVVCPTGGPAYLYDEHQEDSITFGYVNGGTIQRNWVMGGHGTSGGGITVDQGITNVRVIENVAFNTGNGGVGINDGSNVTVTGNKILISNPPSLSGGGGVGIQVWNLWNDTSFGPFTVSNNISSFVDGPTLPCNPITQTCSYQSWLDKSGGTATVYGNTTDDGTFPPGGGPAFTALYPITSTNPPPLIPPMPKNCVATSPYSTQTSTPGCGAIPIRVSVSGSGGITFSPGGTSCGANCHSFAAGTSVTLTAVPSGAFGFSGWGGACSGGATTCVISNVLTSQNATATFAGPFPFVLGAGVYRMRSVAPKDNKQSGNPAGVGGISKQVLIRP